MGRDDTHQAGKQQGKKRIVSKKFAITDFVTTTARLEQAKAMHSAISGRRKWSDEFSGPISSRNVKKSRINDETELFPLFPSLFPNKF
jgi:hypothetical protein